MPKPETYVVVLAPDRSPTEGLSRADIAGRRKAHTTLMIERLETDLAEAGLRDEVTLGVRFEATGSFVCTATKAAKKFLLNHPVVALMTANHEVGGVQPVGPTKVGHHHVWPGDLPDGP